MTDFRALCAELVERIYADGRFWEEELMEAANRARAALAEHEPINHWKEALIDALVVDFLLNEENSNDPKRAIHDIINWNMKLAREPLLAEGDGVGPSDKGWQEFIEQLQHVQHVALGEGAGPRFDLVEFALEAWRSTTNPRPIPVAERLPTEADCDAEGKVWAWDANEEIWYREDVPRLLRGRYVFLWLPAAAIPLPEATP
jgi:hypothetical protein